MVFESERIKTEYNLANVQVVNDLKDTSETASEHVGFSMDTYISQFYSELQDRFKQQFVIQPLKEEFKLPDDFQPPDFLINHYKVKVVAHLDINISEFMKHFVTTEEEKWINFIKEQKSQLVYIDKEFDKQFYLPKDFLTIVRKKENGAPE